MPPRLSLNFTSPLRTSSTASLPPLSYSQSGASTAPASAPQNNATSTLPPADLTPNFCAQFFARYLPAGSHPCFSCYMDPAYAALRARWMKMYVDGHPGAKVEYAERLSGVEGVAERLGLVNVAREVNTAESSVGALGEK